MRAALLSLAVLCCVIVSAFAPGRLADADEAPRVVELVANDFGFESPERIPAGVVTFRMVNKGAELHHAQLVRLDAGKTIEELFAAMPAGHGPPPAWAVWVGGPGLVAPGGVASATLELRAGTYYWLCFVASAADPTPHLAKGMVKAMTVEPGPRGQLPAADNTVMLNDYDFKFGRPLHAGRQVLRVRNYAAQPHEIMVVRLAPGKTTDDLLAWFAGGEQGPPPGKPMGGMQALSQGVAANLEVDLEPGDYAVLCFVPDVKDGRPHIAHGMVQSFTVEAP